VFRYRLHSPDGDDLGEATYALMIHVGDEIHLGAGQRFRVVDVVRCEEEESPFVGLLPEYGTILEPAPSFRRVSRPCSDWLEQPHPQLGETHSNPGAFIAPRRSPVRARLAPPREPRTKRARGSDSIDLGPPRSPTRGHGSGSPDLLRFTWRRDRIVE
jgi:hypothetical protein